MTQQPAAAPQTAAERLAARNKTLEEAGYHIRLMDLPGNERTQRDAGEAIDTLLAENAQLRSIISDLYWMARRYADGRSTYAPSTYNAAIKRAIALDCHLPHTPGEGLFASDGSGRADAAGLTEEENAVAVRSSDYHNFLAAGPHSTNSSEASRAKNFVLQHEFDHEPSFIVPADNPDADPVVTIAPGNLPLARRVLAVLQSEPTASAVTDARYEALQSTRGYWYVDLRNSEGGITVIGGPDLPLTEPIARAVADALSAKTDSAAT